VYKKVCSFENWQKMHWLNGGREFVMALIFSFLRALHLLDPEL